jgi:hypothetical protein
MNDEEALSVIKKFLARWIVSRFIVWGILTIVFKTIEHKLANQPV